MIEENAAELKEIKKKYLGHRKLVRVPVKTIKKKHSTPTS